MAVRTTELVARATLSANYLAAGPLSGALATPANGRTGPFPGQVIPGFSAAVAVANDDGTFWAMPDNGFGTKANSADFRLRIYLVKPNWDRGTRGSGRIEVLHSISLADPGDEIRFPIVHENSRTRLLTGGDFDIESLQRAADGSFWVGEEFGPFLLHFSPEGRLLSAPVPFPLGQSPQSPLLSDDDPNIQPSGGFDGDASVTKRVYRVVLGHTDRSGSLAKTLVADLLKINNPHDIGEGGWGTGDPFTFGFQSVETLVPLPGGRLMIANDNNYPGNSARRPGTPDDTEMIIIDPTARTTVPTHSVTVIGHRGASGYRPEHPSPRTSWPSGSAPT